MTTDDRTQQEERAHPAYYRAQLEAEAQRDDRRLKADVERELERMRSAMSAEREKELQKLAEQRASLHPDRWNELPDPRRLRTQDAGPSDLPAMLESFLAANARLEDAAARVARALERLRGGFPEPSEEQTGQKIGGPDCALGALRQQVARAHLIAERFTAYAALLEGVV